MDDLITIGILVFNCADRLSRLVRSVAEQTYTNTEVIVVDDRSSDRSGEVLVQQLETVGCQNVRLFVNDENLGIGFSRNIVVRESRGDYVVFFDDDDLSSAERLRHQLIAIKRFSSKVDACPISCYCASRKHYSHGSIVLPGIGSGEQVVDGRLVARSMLVNDSFSQKMLVGGGTPTSTAMFRRVDILSAGGFDPSFRRVEDLDLAVRLAAIGCVFVGTRDVLVERFDKPQGKATSPSLNAKYERLLFKKNADFLSTVGPLKFALRWIKVREYFHSGQLMAGCLTLARLALIFPEKTFKQLFVSGLLRIRIVRLSCG